MTTESLDLKFNPILFSQFGERIDSLKSFISLEYVLKENEVCVCDMVLPATFDFDMFDVDQTMEIEISIGDQTFQESKKLWYLRYWDSVRKIQEAEAYNLQFMCANYLLTGCEAEYAAEEDEVQKTGYIDDMMKEIVSENRGPLATDTTRDLSPYLQIQPDASAAPSTTKSFSRREILRTLQELAQDSFNSGTYLVFDNVQVGPATTEFQTFVGQRGTNQGSTSVAPREVSEDKATLTNVKLSYDWRSVYNTIYAGGMGRASDRIMKTAIDTDSRNKSPVNRREKFVNASLARLPETVQAEANYALAQNRFRIRLEGEIQDSKSFRYGRDYRWGDILEAKHKGLSFDIHVDTTHVKVKNGKYEITSFVKGELLL